MDVLVIRSTQMDRVKDFLTELGLEFVQEKHGNGPVHYACERNGFVPEVYPASKTESVRFLEEK